jgi:hypothetical protein
MPPRETGAVFLFRSRQFLLEKLAFVEVGVFAVLPQEFVVGAAFDGMSVVEDAYQVGVTDGRYTV